MTLNPAQRRGLAWAALALTAALLALLAFGHLLGFIGVLIALPVSALILVALRRARGVCLGGRLYQG